MVTLDKIVIFTDGACSGNPGPGGWGVVMIFPEGRVRELGGSERPTTNNRMEMRAIVEALRGVALDLPPERKPLKAAIGVDAEKEPVSVAVGVEELGLPPDDAGLRVAPLAPERQETPHDA